MLECVVCSICVVVSLWCLCVGELWYLCGGGSLCGGWVIGL